MKSLDLFNKDELKETEGISPQNMMNDLACANLKEIFNLQDIVKIDDKSKGRKVHSFNEYYLSFVFKTIHEGHLSLEDTDDEQSNLIAQKQNLDKGKKIREKEFSWNKLRLLFDAREKVLNNFKNRSFLKKKKKKVKF